jgi:hypothetical protein
LGLLSEDESIESVEELAARIHAGLQEQQLVLILDQIPRFVGGVPQFHALFWAPLYRELDRLRTGPVKHRLVLLVVDYAPPAPGWADITCAHDLDAEDTDYQRLLLLPELAPFLKSDLRRWFRDRVRGIDPDTLRTLVDQALEGPGGQLDGTPRRVHDRLREIDLGKYGG